MSLQSSPIFSNLLGKDFLMSGDEVSLEFLMGVVLLLLAFVRSVFFLSPRKRFKDFPVVGKYEDLCHGLVIGTEMYPNRAFAIPTSPPMVILPVSMIDEVKSLPETKVSSARELFRRAAGKHSKMGTNTVAAIRALRTDLSRSLTTIPTLQEETQFAFNSLFGASDEWTLAQLYPKINRIVAMVSGRVFLGKPLCRMDQWVSLTTEWSNDVFALLTRTARYPTWLRPWITPYFSETRRVLDQRARAKALLGPAFSEQLEAKLNNEEPSEESKDTLIGWTIKYLTPRQMNVESLVRHQLGITWASIHTTTYALCNLLFDLAARPEYQYGLRAELNLVLGTRFGGLTQADLAKLKKMDSFMKESQRFNPTTIVAPMRLTVAPLTLSSGQTVPAGVPIGFFSMSINTSNRIHQSPPADVFDGYRFEKKREEEGKENRHQFGTTGPEESLDFGHGIHACPGRFFAAHEMKIMLAYVLQHYDLRLEDGASRPVNSLDEVWFVLDQEAKILFRSRK